jgi:hypothetical protein
VSGHWHVAIKAIVLFVTSQGEKVMKISQVIEAGPVKNFYMSSWTDNELELHVDGGEIKTSLPEDVMKRLHKSLGEKLTTLAKKRVDEAKELAETEDE